ncbi:Hypothetical protein GSB_150695, partial [Giardia duodenalis]
VLSKNRMATEVQALQQEALSTQQTLLSFMRQGDQLKAQIQGLNTLAQMKRITLNALDEVPSSPLYRAIGRCYVSRSREDVVTGIQGEIAKAEKDIGVLKSTVTYAEKKQKETEDKLAEVLKNLQSAAK